MAQSAERLHVLVTDPVITRLGDVMAAEAGDHDWTFAADWSEDRVERVMKDVDVVVASSMSPTMARTSERLRLVHVSGAGFDKIPLRDLPDGVLVANTFHHGRSIAEHVVMVSLMLSRRALEVDREMRSGVWRTVVTDASTPFHSQLNGRSLGLIGFGSIGQEVARLAAALGMSVQAVRRNPNKVLPDGLQLDWVGAVGQLREMAAQVDFLVVTVPLDEATRHLVNASVFSAMKPSAFLINVARGAVVDEDALYQALVGGVIAGAGIDVWWGDPANPSRHPFTELDNVVVTPHHSGNSSATYRSRAREIGGNIRRLADGEALVNIVHPRPGGAA